MLWHCDSLLTCSVSFGQNGKSNRSFRADGAWVKKENNTSSADQRRSDSYVAAYVVGGGDGKPRLHGHFDFKCVALAGVLPAG